MAFYITLFLFSFLLIIFLLPQTIKWAQSLGAIDRPSLRHPHQKPTPRLGGLALASSFWLTVLILQILRPELLRFTDDKILGIDKNIAALFMGSMIVVIVGAVDDISEMIPLKKLLWQIIAAVVIVAMGIKVEWLRNPFGEVFVLGVWSIPLSALWIIFLVNVVNWLDGLDGLASGISLVAFIVLFVLSILVSQISTSLLALIMVAISLGFLLFNFHPAKIFLGDSGSMFLGFILAVLALISGGKVATLTLVLCMPILDFLWVIARRLLNRKSPATADLGHLHHRFLTAGFSQRQTVLLMYGIAAAFGAIALLTETIGKFKAGIVAVAVMFIIGVSLTLWNNLLLRGRKQKKMS